MKKVLIKIMFCSIITLNLLGCSSSTTDNSDNKIHQYNVADQENETIEKLNNNEMKISELFNTDQQVWYEMLYDFEGIHSRVDRIYIVENGEVVECWGGLRGLIPTISFEDICQLNIEELKEYLSENNIKSDEITDRQISFDLYRDDSGNNVERETVVVSGHYIDVKSIIKPTTVLDAEYIGFNDFVTKNIFGNNIEIKLDTLEDAKNNQQMSVY